MQIKGRTIERIVASGCSFTYGQGLDNPETESWPAQLSKLFNVECINLGLPGHGNEYVQSSIIDYFAANPNYKQSSLVVPCFSSYSRIEFNHNDRKGRYINPTWCTLPNSRTEVEFNKKFFETYFVPEYYYDRYIRLIITLQNSLKVWGTPYLMFEGISGNPHKNMLSNKTTNQLITEIDRTNWLRFTTGNLDTMTDPNERLLDGHPNANAYKQMAEILHKHIINTYTE